MIIELVNKLRLSNPWKYKAPLLISWPYALLLLTHTSFYDALLLLALSYCTLFGIAGLGYLINDWADIKADKAAGKQNKVGELQVVYRWLILFLLLSVSFIPWIWLPSGIYSLGLISLEIMLFLTYSVRPFRLKEKGLLGVVVDSMYAYIVPSTLASFTFFLGGQQAYPEFIYFLVVINIWLMFVGIRGILLHQIQDCQNDIGSGTRTFTTRSGIPISERIITTLLPFEIVFLTGFFVFVMYDLYLLFPAFIAFIIARLYTERKNKQVISLKNYRRFSYRFLDDFYLDFLPIVILVHLCLIDKNFICVLIIHILLFRNFIKSIFFK